MNKFMSYGKTFIWACIEDRKEITSIQIKNQNAEDLQIWITLYPM